MNVQERDRDAGDSVGREPLGDPSVFDAVARDYDADFTQTPLGSMLRQRVWSILGRQFTAGNHVLELACGTGEDAVWLAKRGVRVTATDGSSEMARVARAKVAYHGLGERVSIERWSLEEVAGSWWQGAGSRGQGAGGRGHGASDDGWYDGAFSNFGGLNAIGDWRPLAEALSHMIGRGGRLVLVVMGPYCPWEIAWYLVQGRPRSAFRRFNQRVTAKVGAKRMTVWYPTAGRLRRDFSPWFRRHSVESLGLWLPPTYLGRLVTRWPGLFARLNSLESGAARLSGGWGDHYVVVFERMASAAGS